MKNTKAALIWITDILNKYHIPFQVTGGLAANFYGSTRVLEGIDIDIPENTFDLIKNEVSHFIIFGPENFKSDKWDLLLMTLHYQGQEIDLSGAYNTKILDEKRGKWQQLNEDLSTAIRQNVLGLELPVISRNRLISYKKILARKEDIIDINEIESK